MEAHDLILSFFLLALVPSLAPCLWIWRRRRYGVLFWIMFGMGAVGFYAAQIPKSVVALAYFSSARIPLTAPQEELFKNTGVLAMSAVSAGVFEELFKFIGPWAFRKRIRTPSDAMCYGFGAGAGGGILEAIVLGFAARSLVAANPIEVTLDILAGPVERVSAIFLHAALTALFAYLFVTGRWLWGFAASASYHALVNFVATGLIGTGFLTNIWALEGIIAVFALALYPVLFKLYTKSKVAPTVSSSSPASVSPESQPRASRFRGSWTSQCGLDLQALSLGGSLVSRRALAGHLGYTCVDEGCP